MEPEEAARRRIDAALADAGWVVQDYAAMNLSAAAAIAVREFQLARGHGDADRHVPSGRGSATRSHRPSSQTLGRCL